ncbi:MAG: DUF2147 domain-containing protein [Spirochaetales bacterium]
MRFIVILGVLLVAGATGLFADQADKAVGYWKSISDVKGEEGKVTAIWKLSVTSAGELQGAIVFVPDESPTKIYVSKKKEYNGLPVWGTLWMKGLKKSGADSWGGGTIVDVGNDKADVYGCEVKVIANATKLDMRGYIGFAFIGRTQTWVAVSEDEVKKLLGK